MDRENLVNWSLDLTDESFLSALAALGVLSALPRPLLADVYGPAGWRIDKLPKVFLKILQDGSGILRWRVPAISTHESSPRIRIAQPDTRRSVAVLAPEASELAAVWQELVTSLRLTTGPMAQGPRLAVFAQATVTAWTMKFLDLLARPELGAASVYLDDALPTDGRTQWRWPFTLATFPGDLLAQPFANMQRQLPKDNPFRFAIASPDEPRLEVLVIEGGASDALVSVLSCGLQLRCNLVIVAGLGCDSAITAEPLLRALAAKVSAQGVAVVVPDRSTAKFLKQIRDFADQLAHRQTIDVALTQAFYPGGLLLLNRDLLTLSLPKMAKAKAPTSLLPPSRDMAGASAPIPTVPRYFQQKSFCKLAGKFLEQRTGYCVGQPVMVQVFIGVRRADTVSANTAFPEDKLPPNRDSHRLTLVFHEPRQFDQPMLSDIFLPRVGDSSTANFVFTPRAAGEFEGRISVLHRGRVLQTLLLHTRVAAVPTELTAMAGCLTLDEEVQVRHDWSDLGHRRQFDVAMVLNHSTGGKPLLTGIAGKRAWATSLQGIEQPVRKINELISAVAHSVADYGDGLDQGENPALLVQLARVGANLYSVLYRDQLKLLTSDGFDPGAESVTCLQVISARPDAVVPLEFMYDFNAPLPDATVCPQHREALEKGRCPAHCARSLQPRAHVCPMGFWGLKKVIERHLFDPRAVVPAGAEVVVQVEALEGRDRIDLKAGALVGHSKEVSVSEVARLVKTLGAGLGSKVPVAKNWASWLRTVKTRHPALLVAFPHNEGREENVLLEIGGDKLYTLDLPVDYVHPPRGASPLVILLGCDVAGTAQDYSSHIRYFRQAGAAVVVSTIATVFGAHAVRVGQAIAAGLVDPSSQSDKRRIGEVIRDAKRAALLDSVPMALCVVAFGDADWRL